MTNSVKTRRNIELLLQIILIVGAIAAEIMVLAP